MSASRFLDPRAYVRFAGHRWNVARSRSRLDEVSRSGEQGARLAGAMRRVRDGELGESRAWIDRIEAERQRLSRDDTPLVKGDGGGPSGPFDAGETIARACGVSKKRGPATALHMIVREFGPTLGLELGTNLGISSSYQAAAMRLAGRGRMITCEGSPVRSGIARGLHERLGLENVEYVVGLFADTLESVLADNEPFDYVFIDGHHQKQPTLDYFEAIAPHLAPEAVVVFDDIRWSPGMREAWDILSRDHRFSVALDLDIMGVCTLGGQEKRIRSGIVPV